MGKKRGISGFFVMASLLAGVILFLTGSLIWKQAKENGCYQFFADLGGMEYDGDFLKNAGKIQGIRQVYPVLEIPVRLKINDYVMDTVATAVDLEVLDKRVWKTRESPLGNIPVLLLGKDSLAEMRDSNDHVISREEQKKFLEDYTGLEMEYSAVLPVSGDEKGGEEQWKECIAAGILSSPAEGIYLPYDQGRALCEKAGSLEIKKALITVQGKENYERALSYFEALEKTQDICFPS